MTNYPIFYSEYKYRPMYDIYIYFLDGMSYICYIKIKMLLVIRYLGIFFRKTEMIKPTYF